MDRTYNIGRVLGGGVAVMKRGFLTLIAIVLIFAVVPTILSYAVILPAMGGLGADPAAQAAAFSNANWALIGPAYLVSALIAAASYPALFHAAIRLLDGERADIMESVMHGIRRALPFLVLAILMYFGTVFGLVLLIVPGLILLVRWSTALQALSVEPIGVFGAFSRSADLTRGSRWRIVLLVLVSFVIFSALGFVLFAVLGAAGGGSVGFSVSGAPALIAQTAIGAFITVFFIGVGAAHYVELRTVREGAGTDRLAEVFA